MSAMRLKNARGAPYIIAAVTALAELSGCVGAARIEAPSPADAALTCRELSAQRQAVQLRLADLGTDLARGPSIGGAFGPAGTTLVLDDRDTLLRKIDHLTARDDLLDRLVRQRCPPPVPP